MSNFGADPRRVASSKLRSNFHDILRAAMEDFCQNIDMEECINHHPLFREHSEWGETRSSSKSTLRPQESAETWRKLIDY